MVPGHINHSDDELAFLSFYPLLRYETDPPLLDVYKQSLERSWQIERPERNPLWNVIYAAGTGATGIRSSDESLRTLREIPMDLIEWTVKNSHRAGRAGRPARRPLQAAPGAGRAAVRRAADVEVERQSLQPRRRQRRHAAKTTARISCCRTGWGGITACLKSEAVDRGPRSAARGSAGSRFAGSRVRFGVIRRSEAESKRVVASNQRRPRTANPGSWPLRRPLPDGLGVAGQIEATRRL